MTVSKCSFSCYNFCSKKRLVIYRLISDGWFFCKLFVTIIFCICKVLISAVIENDERCAAVAESSLNVLHQCCWCCFVTEARGDGANNGWFPADGDMWQAAMSKWWCSQNDVHRLQECQAISCVEFLIQPLWGVRACHCWQNRSVKSSLFVFSLVCCWLCHCRFVVQEIAEHYSILLSIPLLLVIWSYPGQGYSSAAGHFMWLVWSLGTVSHCTFIPHLHYQLSKTCSRHIFSHLPTSLTNWAANIVRRPCSDSSHVTAPYQIVVLLLLLLSDQSQEAKEWKRCVLRCFVNTGRWCRHEWISKLCRLTGVETVKKILVADVNLSIISFLVSKSMSDVHNDKVI